MELRPHGDPIIDQRAPAQQPRRIPRGVQTLAAVGEPTTQAEEPQNSDRAPGGDGEAEGRDSMDKLHRERIVFKGTIV